MTYGHKQLIEVPICHSFWQYIVIFDNSAVPGCILSEIRYKLECE